MKKIFKVSLTLMAVLLSIAFAWAEDVGLTKVTTPRSWDFTKGANHADQVTGCDYWSSGSKGRYNLEIAIEDQELPGNDGVLTGLEGIYLTLPKAAVYGVTGNYCLQANTIDVRIPNCGANDEIVVDFAVGTAKATATMESDDIIETGEFTQGATASSDATKQVVHAKADGDVTVKNAEGDSFKFNTNNGACYHSDKTANIASGIYKGDASTLTISGGSYTPYFAVEAVDPADLKEEFDVTFAAGDFENVGELPAALKVEAGQTFTVPANFTMYQEGKTLTGWSDGDKTYAIGEEVTVSEAMTLTPVFVDNTVSLADRTEPVTVTFEFQRQNGAPVVAYQNVTGIWVAQAKIGDETIDVKADFDTNNGGKFANGNWNDWAQLNGGTTFTVPSCKGAVISLESYSATTTTTIDGQDIADGTKNPSFTCAGDAATVKVVIGDGSYFRYIKVVLPVVETSTGGTTYTDQEASVIWPFNNKETYATVVEVSPEGAFSTTAFSTDLVVTGTGTRTAAEDPAKDADGNDVNFVKFKANSSASDPLTWVVKPAKGLTFTPTRVSGWIQRFGTDVKEGVTVTLKNADGANVALGTFTALRANKNHDNKDYDANAVNKFDIELTAEQSAALATGSELTLVVSVGVSSGKEGGFSDIQIHGTLNGTTEDVAKYTLSAVADNAEAGSVKIYPAADEYEVGSEVKLTAEKNFGYKFVNWTDADGKEVSDKAEFVYTVEANAELTANFETVNTYEVAYVVNGGNDYQVAATPAPVVVDGKNMYEEGTTVTLKASSNKVVKFNNWQDGSTSSEYTFTVDADKTDIVAEYAADDYVAIWDFIRPGNNGRVADFYTEGNDVSTLVLVDAEGNTKGWLDKSELGNGGYEGRPGGVNWNTDGLGKYAWQITFNAEAFTDIKLNVEMVFNYNSYTTYDVEFSVDNGTTWTKVGSIELPGAKAWTDEEFTLPAEANNQAAVMVRFIADKESEIKGTKSDNDGCCMGAIYVTGAPKLIDDGTAPVLESTVPVEGADNASINGKIVLTFDEKVKVKEGVKATLGDFELEPVVTGKVVTFSYKNLSYVTDYTFTLPAGAVSDLTDNAYNEAIVINFATKSRPEVAKGHYDRVVKTVDELVAAITDANKRADQATRFRIFIHNGEYVLPASATATKVGSDNVAYPDPTTTLTGANVSFIGESRDGVVITNTATSVLEGIGKGDVLRLEKNAVNTYFQHLTIKSAMGDNKGRDIVVNDGGDKTIMKDVCLWAYQDTYVSNNDKSRYYFEGGVLRGRTDFLCGKGDVFYNGVTLRIINGGTLTAPSASRQYGYVFRDCEIIGDDNTVDGSFTLGRPWGAATPSSLYINTKMSVQPTALGWGDMGDDWYPARFAEYNSTTASGTVIDLKNRKKTFGSGNHPNDPVLTKAEADVLTLAAVLGGEDDWDPSSHAEQAPAATNVKHTDTSISWDDNQYASLWAVLKDGEIIGFTTEPKFELPVAGRAADDAVYSVRAANEMGGLGEAVKSTYTALVGIDKVAADEPVETRWYNLQGQRVSDKAEGVLIRVDILANGQTVTTKVVK